ncbi:MAG TPA: hypothetical protein VGX92_12680 [Pyrinomonadaceae bacterium]|jgi:hypothetical protein|nr:hypothetical protein [Pyrinomonadaceae bacterium]
MSSRLSVIFYIILCLEVGIVLTLLPWVHPFGLSDWADNYFLVYAAHKTGFAGLQHAVSSGWVRGAVTGLGLLNLGIALWEIAHFRQTVHNMQAEINKTPATRKDAEPEAAAAADHLSDNERRDQSGQ